MTFLHEDSDNKPASSRRAIPKRVRFEVLRRDNYTCRYCRSTENALTIDHVTPTVLGGADDPSNLVAACRDCNAGKSSSSPDAAIVADVAEDALRWRRAMAAAVEEVRAEWDAAGRYGEQVAGAWDNGNECYRRGRAGLPENWLDTVEHWRSLGLPADLVCDAIGVAMRNRLVEAGNVWRYACGVAWKRVADLRERAAQLLAEGA